MTPSYYAAQLAHQLLQCMQPLNPRVPDDCPDQAKQMLQIHYNAMCGYLTTFIDDCEMGRYERE